MDQEESDEQTVLMGQISALESEHRDLDDVIERITSEGLYDQLQVQRLKKRKLVLKDQLERLHSKMIPDDIA